MITQKSFTAPITNNDDANRGFARVRDTLNPVLQTALLDGVLTASLTIPSSGKLVVPHGLGRTARGWLVTSANAAVALPYALSADQTSASNALVLTFSSGAGATVSLWVF
jgi:hypothetical protein